MHRETRDERPDRRRRLPKSSERQRTTPAGAPPARPYLGHQRALGNQAVQRFAETCPLALPSPSFCPFGGVCHQCPPRVQAKLAVSQPGERYEQEADRVADAVMRIPDPQRETSGGLEAGLRITSIGRSAVSRAELRPRDMVDSALLPEGELLEAETPGPTVQRSGAGGVPEVAPSIQTSIEQARSGRPLSRSARRFMEPRFRRDFSTVQIHADSAADRLARGVCARAFTVGENVFFARSQFCPETGAGRHLLAHELTHVVQQRGSDRMAPRLIQRQVAHPCPRYNGYNSSVSLWNYNCAGLAHRTYNVISPASAVVNALAAMTGGSSIGCNDRCGASKIKHWLWEYDLSFEDDLGSYLQGPSPDFHTVAGLTDSSGNDPTDVYSKNGYRRVYGPNTGPYFRPPTRARVLSNDPSETPSTHNGRPVYKVRTNYKPSCFCVDC